MMWKMIVEFLFFFSNHTVFFLNRARKTLLDLRQINVYYVWKEYGYCSPGRTCIKTVGSLCMNSMMGFSAMASSRKKTTVDAQATVKAIRAPKRSPNLPVTHRRHKFSDG